MIQSASVGVVALFNIKVKLLITKSMNTGGFQGLGQQSQTMGFNAFKASSVQAPIQNTFGPFQSQQPQQKKHSKGKGPHQATGIAHQQNLRTVQSHQSASEYGQLAIQQPQQVPDIKGKKTKEHWKKGSQTKRQQQLNQYQQQIFPQQLQYQHQKASSLPKHPSQPLYGMSSMTQQAGSTLTQTHQNQQFGGFQSKQKDQNRGGKSLPPHQLMQTQQNQGFSQFQTAPTIQPQKRQPPSFIQGKQSQFGQQALIDSSINKSSLTQRSSISSLSGQGQLQLKEGSAKSMQGTQQALNIRNIKQTNQVQQNQPYHKSEQKMIGKSLKASKQDVKNLDLLQTGRMSFIMDEDELYTHEEKKQTLCKHFMKGQCRFGDKCKSIHSSSLVQSTEICQFFISGECKYGDKCLKSHQITPQMVQKLISQNQKAGLQKTQNVDISKNNFTEKEEDNQQEEYGEYDDEEYYGQYYDEQDQNEEVATDKDKKKKEDLSMYAEINKGKQLRDELAKPIQPQTQQITPQKPVAYSPLIQEETKALRPKVQIDKDKTLKASKPVLVTQSSQIDEKVLNQRRNEIMAELKEIQKNPNVYKIPGVAELLSFCSDKEIHRRSEIEKLSASQFEKDDQGKSFDRFAIKEYQRSAADKIMNESSEIRPPIVLYKVVEYIRDCIVDQDSVGNSGTSREFMAIYSFARDRLRCVANDFIILNDPCNEFQIKALEESSRFLILAYHDGFVEKDFSSYQNTQILTKILGSLKTCYRAVKSTYPIGDQTRDKLLQNEAEFISYLIIASSNDQLQTQDEISQLDFQSLSLNQRDLIKTALQVNFSISNNDTHTFFKFLKTVPYLFKCIMLFFLNEMRKIRLEQLSKTILKEYASLDFLMISLMMENSEDAASFAEACGFELFNEAEDSVSLLKNDRSKQDWNEKFKMWKQSGKLTALERSRGSALRRSLIKKGLQPERRIQSIEEEKKIQKKPLTQLVVSVIDKEKEEREKEIQKQKIEAIEKQKEVEKLKRLEEEEKRKMQQIQEVEQKKAMEEKRKLEKEEKAKQELKRMKEKQDKAISAFQKFAMIMKRNSIKKLLIGEFKEFSQVYMQRLGKRKVRDYINELEQQLIEALPLESYIPDPMRSKVLKVLEGYEYHPKGLHLIKMRQWLKALMIQSGDLKIKLLSSRIRPENTERLLWDLLQMLILFANNSTLPKITAQMLKTPYYTEVKEEITYSFEYVDLDKISNEEDILMNQNLLLFLTSQQTCEQDLEKFRRYIKDYPEYSRLNVTFLIYGHEYKQYINFSEKIDSVLSDDKSCQRISSLLTIPLMFLQPVNKRKVPSGSNVQTLKKLLLAYILPDLEKAVLHSYLDKTTFAAMERLSLRELTLTAVQDLSFMDVTDIKLGVVQEIDKAHKRIFTDLKAQLGTDVDSQLEYNELQVFNCWLLVLQQMLSPLTTVLQETVQALIVGSKKKSEVRDDLDNISQSLQFINRIQVLDLLKYPVDQNERYNVLHLKYFVAEGLKDIFVEQSQNQSFQEILSDIDFITTYKDVAPLQAEKRFYKGALIFSSFFKYFSNILPELYARVVSLFDPLSLYDIDFNRIQELLRKSIKSNRTTDQELKQLFPGHFSQIKPSQKFKQTKKLKSESLLRVPSSSNGAFESVTQSIRSLVEQAKQSNEVQLLQDVFDEFKEKNEALVQDYRAKKCVSGAKARENETQKKQRMPSVAEINRLLEQEKKTLEAQEHQIGKRVTRSFIVAQQCSTKRIKNLD